MPLTLLQHLPFPGDNQEKFLRRHPPENQSAGPAFVVVGTGKEALKNAASVFSKEPADWPKTAPADSEVSLVFYSFLCGYEVQLTKVEKSHDLVRVDYRFADHFEMYQSMHFALIPLGKLSAGNVHVQIGDAPKAGSQAHKRPKSRLRQRMSQSSSFEVRG